MSDETDPWRRFRAAHTACAMWTLFTFVRQCPQLFERRPDWLVLMWSAANVMVRPKGGQAKTLKSGLQTILPIIVELLTARLQVHSILIEKEEMTDVELIVEHIRKAKSGCPDLANWPNHTTEIEVPGCSMRFKIRSLDSF